MAQIDSLLQSMAKFGAQGALLASGEKVQLVFPTGKRYASQTTPHDSLVKLVTEIVPSNTHLNKNGGTTFIYNYNGSAVTLRVDAAISSWRVGIEVHPIEAPSAADERAEGFAAETAPAPATSVPPPVPKAAHAPPSYANVQVDSAIEKLMLKMLELGASDLHLSSGAVPTVRLHGVIQPIPGYPPFSGDELLARLYEITPERNREEYERRHDTDFAHAIPNVSRFRANLFRDRRGPGAVFRAIPFEIRSPDEIGLPKSVLELCQLTKGLVLVTGPTGSGKSTTLATLIDHINQNRTDHIITIEDPIEFVHENKKCLVNQREVHAHTDSFKDALRAALREDPDIVLVGEMRDLETIAIAVETAETGHLVFGTLHTTTAPSTVDRIIDQFPADRQEQIRTMLAGSLKGVISQTLCKKIGGGRVAAYEILICNSAVANLIRERKIFQIYSVIQTSKQQGMTTLNDSLLTLVKAKQVDVQEAYAMAVNKSEFAAQLTREGVKVGGE
ncbi:MAG TPA: type IV pilus twitching motility protein PilT [Thermoanaerobaculia bacterium]|nr:type IV pilus twitching motility protein PilT [Thermoanaerobaculia bacterium]